LNLDGQVIPLVAALTAAIAAPLAAALHVGRGGSQAGPRTPAIVSLLVSLVASLTITRAWMSGPEVTLELGQRLGGGYLVHIDGLTAVLLPFVALVELAIVMVAPKRFLDGPATVRILLGAATTLALFATSHPLVLIVAWVVTALPTWSSTRATPGGQIAARVYAIIMTIAVACMTVGTLMMIADPPWEAGGGAVGASGGWLVALAVLEDGLAPRRDAARAQREVLVGQEVGDDQAVPPLPPRPLPQGLEDRGADVAEVAVLFGGIGLAAQAT
jgi:hypothetical protein